MQTISKFISILPLLIWEVVKVYLKIGIIFAMVTLLLLIMMSIFTKDNYDNTMRESLEDFEFEEDTFWTRSAVILILIISAILLYPIIIAELLTNNDNNE